MTRREIAQSIARDLGLTQLQTNQLVQKVFDAILDTLVDEERVELRNFGVFQVKRRGPRKARNPRTGERVLVPDKCVVAFKPGHVMQQRVEGANEITYNTVDLTVSFQPLGREILGAFSLADILSVAGHEARNQRRKDIYVIGLAEETCRKLAIGPAPCPCDSSLNLTLLGGMNS